MPLEQLALFPWDDGNGRALRASAARAGLRPVQLMPPPAVRPDIADDRVAWRLPVGLLELMLAEDPSSAPRLAAAPAGWITTLPRSTTGRGMQLLTVDELLAGTGLRLDGVGMLKLARGKSSRLRATRTTGLQHARSVARRSGLPGSRTLLVADRWIECRAEYRTFTVGRTVVAASPYVIEGEIWSPHLGQHRAQRTAEAAHFAGLVLAALPADDVPPACVLDVIDEEDGRWRLLEVNTAWGSGLYSCSADTVLTAVLAAQQPRSRRWDFSKALGRGS